MNDKQLMALARKNAAKAQRVSKKKSPAYDATLDATRPVEAEEPGETAQLFREMKKREF